MRDIGRSAGQIDEQESAESRNIVFGIFMAG
jgi:hypothetical protein